MTYREAFKIGSRCDGIIRCTYACLYDRDGKALFSLQRKQASYETQPGMMFDINSGIVTYAGRDADIQGAITYDLPLVIADHVSDERLVPAHMTDQAIEIITNACAKIRAIKYIIYMVNDLTGEKTKMQETYNLTQSDQNYWLRKRTQTYHHEIEKEDAIAPKYRRLSEILEKRETVYIRPLAFDWAPLNIENATITNENGEIVNLNIAVEQAENKLKQAKTLLALSAAATLI